MRECCVCFSLQQTKQQTYLTDHHHPTDPQNTTTRWKKACEGGGAQTDPSAMKDYKTLPFLRRAVNVIAVPDRVATAEEAVRTCMYYACL